MVCHLPGLVSCLKLSISSSISKIHTYTQSSPWNVDDPLSGKREVVTDPWDLEASEYGWQSDGDQNYTTTQGNNGMAVQDYFGETTNLYQPTAPEQKFEYDLHLNESDPNAYRDASIAQLFYTANFYHDVLYELGFTEEAGNFQANNNGKGGADNDAVILSAQDTYDTNNAVFSSPPDGQSGLMLVSSAPRCNINIYASVPLQIAFLNLRYTDAALGPVHSPTRLHVRKRCCRPRVHPRP